MTDLRRWIAGVWLILGAALCGHVFAHESQPGLLELRQLGPERYEVIWRAPIYYGKPHPAELRLPRDWSTVGEPRVRQLPDSALHRRIGDRCASRAWQESPMIGDAPGHLARSGSFALLENYEAKTGGAPIPAMSPGMLATSTSRRPRPRRCCSTSMPECRGS
jgi:hypothetical protein